MTAEIDPGRVGRDGCDRLPQLLGVECALLVRRWSVEQAKCKKALPPASFAPGRASAVG